MDCRVKPGNNEKGTPVRTAMGTSIYSDFECRGERRSCKVRFF